MALFMAGLFSMSPVQAQGPENTLVVVNVNSPDSLAVANRYVELRDIPAVNVVYLNLSKFPTLKNDFESTGSRPFREKILEPIFKEMRDRGIEKQIDCIAYSAGFPTRINFLQEMKEYLKQTGKKYNIVLHAPWASITSLTYFHHRFTSKFPNFLELDANSYANPQRMKVLANPFSGDDAARFNAAITDIKAGNFEPASKKLISLGRNHGQQMAVVYALARSFALNGEIERSINALKHVKKLGFASRSLLQTDKAFGAIKSHPDFKEIVKQMEDLPDGISPTRPFSSQQYWGKNGWPNGTSTQGERYLLCSVLAVTGKNQSTLKDSLKRLESSSKADGSSPEGNVYFADHKDVRTRTRRGQFPAAVKELQSLGHKASVGSDIYPLGDQRVIGATLGSPSPKWNLSKSKFLPGAICDNLTSAGAFWGDPNQTKLSAFLDAGAAGATGTVYEPYTIQAKFPSARWHAHYARGCTLAESFYQSVSGPFQLLLVGDPLCCPFGKFPKFTATGLENSATITGDITLSFTAAPSSPKIRHYEVFFDGVFLSEVSDPNTIRVVTDALNDGFHEIRIVAVADSPTANRSTKKLAFQLNRRGESVEFTIQNTKTKTGEKLSYTAQTDSGREIEVHHNFRVVAKSRSGKQGLIDTSKIGLGRSMLQAVVRKKDGSLQKSVPIEVSVVN